MNKRILRAAVVTATVTAAVAAVSTAAVAAGGKPPQPAGPSTPPEGSPLAAITRAYAKAYPSMSQAQVRTAAQGSDARKALQDQLVKSGSTFGGSWYDAPTNTLHVAETTAAARSAASSEAASLGVRITTHAVTRSYSQLQAQANALRASRTGLGRLAAGNVGIDVASNSVVAAVPTQFVTSARSTSNQGVRVVAKQARSVQADAACTSRSACDYTIRAGNTLWRGSASSSPVCSVGFTARQTNNARWVYTAGHCSNGNGVTWGTGARPIGTMYASRDSGNLDVSVIQVTNPWFAGDQGGEIYNTVYVNGVAPTLSYMVPGETVCLSANYTQPSGGNFCGVLNSTSDASNRGLVRVNGLDGCPGDSGGGWYWLSSSGRRVAYGLHSRSDLGCHGDQGGSVSWFTALPTVKSSYTPWLDVETRP